MSSMHSSCSLPAVAFLLLCCSVSWWDLSCEWETCQALASLQASKDQPRAPRCWKTDHPPEPPWPACHFYPWTRLLDLANTCPACKTHADMANTCPLPVIFQVSRVDLANTCPLLVILQVSRADLANTCPTCKTRADLANTCPLLVTLQVSCADHQRESIRGAAPQPSLVSGWTITRCNAKSRKSQRGAAEAPGVVLLVCSLHRLPPTSSCEVAR